MFYYPLAALAIAGAWALRRRRAELWVLLAPFVLTSLIAAATYGSLRLRYLAELPLVLLAALGASTLWSAGRFDALVSRRVCQRLLEGLNTPRVSLVSLLQRSPRRPTSKPSAAAPNPMRGDVLYR